jgi:hypothetical protein
MPEFDAGVAGGESPVDLAFVGVGGVGPGGEFGVEDVEVGDAPAEALLGQAGQFDLRPDETSLVNFARSPAPKQTVNCFGRGTPSTPSGRVSTRATDHTYPSN